MQSGTGYLTHLYFDFVSSTISQHRYHQVTVTIKWDRSLTGLLAHRKLHIIVSKEQREEGPMGGCAWSSGGSHVRRGKMGRLKTSSTPPAGWRQGSLSLAQPQNLTTERAPSHWSLAPLVLGDMGRAWVDLASVWLDVRLDYHLSVWPKHKTASSHQNLGSLCWPAVALSEGATEKRKLCRSPPASLRVSAIQWLPLNTLSMFCFSQDREPEKSSRNHCVNR